MQSDFMLFAVSICHEMTCCASKDTLAVIATAPNQRELINLARVKYILETIHSGSSRIEVYPYSLSFLDDK